MTKPLAQADIDKLLALFDRVEHLERWRQGIRVDGAQYFANPSTGLQIAIPKIPRQQLPQMRGTLPDIKFGRVTASFTADDHFTCNQCTSTGVDIGGTITIYVKRDGDTYATVTGTEVPVDTIVPYVTDAAGVFFVFGHDPIEVMTNFQIDGATKKYQKKARNTWGTVVGTESDWIDIITGAGC